MNDNHLSVWEQEEYVLGQRTPEMMRHLAACAGCQGSVARLENGVSLFRATAVEWAGDSLAARPQQVFASARRLPMIALRWAIAGVFPILVLIFALLAFHSSGRDPERPIASMSDDALLDQVDDQLSVAVPSSMESLTHLVSTEKNGQPDAALSERGGKHLVQTN